MVDLLDLSIQANRLHLALKESSCGLCIVNSNVQFDTLEDNNIVGTVEIGWRVSAIDSKSIEELASLIEERLKCKVVQYSVLCFPSSSKPIICLLYTSPSPRDKRQSRMPSSA